MHPAPRAPPSLARAPALVAPLLAAGSVPLDAGAVAASPGLWLVLGGAALLVMLLGVLLVQGAPPAPPEPRRADAPPATAPLGPALDARSPVYRGPRDEEYARGRLAGARVRATDVDGVLDYVAMAQMARPRVLRSLPNLLRVRFHACGGCAGRDERGPSAHGVDGCAFECGFLEGSFEAALGSRVIVHEVSCRARGASACDFEVWY